MYVCVCVCVCLCVCEYRYASVASRREAGVAVRSVCVAECGSVLQCVAVKPEVLSGQYVLQSVAVCSSV